MRYYKVINTTTKEELYVTANCMDRVVLYLIKEKSADWFYGVNIVEVNADKSRPRNGDFMCMAVREYYVDTYGTEDDKAILNKEYAEFLASYKRRQETLTDEEITTLANLCRGYDPFTYYIDDYRQMKSAQAANKQLDEEFNRIMAKIDGAYDRGVPFTLQNVRDTKAGIKEWLKNYK